MSTENRGYDIDALLDEVVTLPSLPSTVARITELVNNPDTPLSEVGKAIASDPALALKSLRLVNSAYYGLREKVSSVEHAVVLLGAKVIRNLVFTASVFQTLESAEEDFLRHCVACGVAMKNLCETPGVSRSAALTGGEAFIFGLLHDTGKLLFREFLPREYAEVAALSTDRRVPWVQAEKEVLGITHADLGARLARKWKLSDELADAIAGHHDVANCVVPGHRGAAALLGAADYICHACGLAEAGVVPPRLSDEAWALTGLDSVNVLSALEATFASYGSIEELVALAA